MTYYYFTTSTHEKEPLIPLFERNFVTLVKIAKKFLKILGKKHRKAHGKLKEFIGCGIFRT